MKKKIFHNWGLKLTSLLLAFILWFLAVQINDPKETVTFSGISVRLTNTNLFERENKVYEVLDNSDVVRVTIRAPKSITKDLRASDIVAVADVSKLTDINTIAISYSIQGVPTTSYDSIRGDHETVRLDVEEKASKWIRVQNQTVGEVAEGYQVMSTTGDQNLIEVTGPESAVAKISYARAEVDVSGASANLSLNVEPQFYDVDGNLLDLPSVVKNVSYIHMNVEVLAVKEVPVVLNVMGTPAEGYVATGYVDCEPDTVKIAGTASALSGVSAVTVPAEALDITGATDSVVSIINLRDYLKDSIKFADSIFNGRVTATVEVQPIVDRTIVLRGEAFDLVNIPQDYSAELIVPETGYELTLSGLEEVVSGVQQELIRGQVDVAAWLAQENMEEPEDGDYEMPVDFTLPSDVDMEDEMKVTIRLIRTEEI